MKRKKRKKTTDELRFLGKKFSTTAWFTIVS